MTFSRAVTLVLASLLLATNVLARLRHVTGESQTLLQYGSAESPQHFVLQVNVDEKVLEASVHTLDTHILTSHHVSVERISDSLSNISVTHMFDRFPGDVNYQLSVTTRSANGAENRYTMERTHSVYGMVFFTEQDEHTVVSGDFGNGLDLVTPETDTQSVHLKYKSHAPDNVVDLGVVTHVISHGEKHSVLHNDDVSFDHSGLELTLHAGRQGASMVLVECRKLVVDGEAFETFVPVRVGRPSSRHH